MAYKTEELKETALIAITKHHLTDIEAISAFMGIANKTFYEHKLQESQPIKEAIFKEKSVIKQTLKAKWFGSENATLQIALYKLLGSEEECHKLNGTKSEYKLDYKENTSLLMLEKIAEKQGISVDQLLQIEGINLGDVAEWKTYY